MIRITFFLIFSIIAFSGCRKNELKKPTDVGIKMDINRDISSDGRLVFTSGTVLLASFDIEGERQEGESIAFSKSFDQGLSVNLNATAVPELEFDIPQGNYHELVISFDTFDDNGESTIVVNGTYTNTGGDSFPLRFEFASSEYFSIVGEDDSGNASIVLEKDVVASSLIKFDPIHWFDIISDNKFNNADLVDVNGVMTILINEDENSDIYDLVADRIDEATESLW